MKSAAIARAGLILAAALVLIGVPGAAWFKASADRPAADPVVLRARQILAGMSVERKVAQLIMPDISAITPADMRRYRFGTILNGGNSGPGGNDRAPAPQWLALADSMWQASTAPQDGGEPVIPMLWATDAVHGHSNIPGATLFPHNVGLGATRDAALVQQIGAATAQEIAVTGIDWTFAPTIAVVRDVRWGRSYESYAEDPALVGRLGSAMVTGLQGEPGSAEFLDQSHVIATIKHFFGDGGTGGKDQGDAKGAMPDLIRVHAAPYRPGIAAGAQTVMASFSSINGIKMHGNRSLLVDLLRTDMGFGGLVVGDWNGHGQIPGCSNGDCPQALLAGLDVFMVPEDWKALLSNLVAEVGDGRVPMARLDEAVLRVLELKLRYGLFDKPAPARRALAGNWAVLGSAPHRALARAAVRESLVLLKNDGVLPLEPSARVLVAGPAADSVPDQVGGWSITWQGGGDLTNADFPGATSIYRGIADAVQAGGGQVELSPAGSFRQRPDVAIVVFGEPPYAEFMGDRPDFALHDEQGLEILRRLHRQGIRTVAVLLSGRPLWVNREIAAADAFVAAWLPGSEGAGLADVLIGNPQHKPRHDFTGKLSFRWPDNCLTGAAGPFRFGYGLSYKSPHPGLVLGQRCPALSADTLTLRIFDRGLLGNVTASAHSAGSETMLPALKGQAASGFLLAAPLDFKAQEDARRIEWQGPGDLAFVMRRQTGLPKNGELVLLLALDQPPAGSVSLVAICPGCRGKIDLTASMRLAAGKGWREIAIPLACVTPKQLRGFALRSTAGLRMKLAVLSIRPRASPGACQGPF